MGFFNRSITKIRVMLSNIIYLLSRTQRVKGVVRKDLRVMVSIITEYATLNRILSINEEKELYEIAID